MSRVLENSNEYIEGIQCGNIDCYACATQRYNCAELNRLDAENNSVTKEDMPGFEGTWDALESLVDNNPDDGSWGGR